MNNRYQYAEKMLYQYVNNVSALHESLDALRYITGHGDIRVQTYEESSSGCGVSDRVLDYVHRVESLEKRIERLEASTEPVRCVLERLERDGGELASKLYEVYETVYENGSTEGLELVKEDELYEMRRLLVHKVMREYKRYMIKRYCNTLR